MYGHICLFVHSPKNIKCVIIVSQILDCYDQSFTNCNVLLLLTGAGADNCESCFRDVARCPITSPVRGSTKNI